MTIGGSIALIVIGAILAFAVEFDIAGLSITAIGYIMMIGGLIGLVLGMIASQRSSVTRRTVDEPVRTRRVVEERPTRERVVEDREIY
jgi:hypothetical protein